METKTAMKKPATGQPKKNMKKPAAAQPTKKKPASSEVLASSAPPAAEERAGPASSAPPAEERAPPEPLAPSLGAPSAPPAEEREQEAVAVRRPRVPDRGGDRSLDVALLREPYSSFLWEMWNSRARLREIMH